MIEFKDEAHKEEILRSLDITIAHWATIVKEDRGGDNKGDSFPFDEMNHYPRDWDHQCYLCNNYGPVFEECPNCPMSGLWSGAPSCVFEASSFQRYSHATSIDRQEKAVVVLQDLVSARKKYRKQQVKKQKLFFRLKPLDKLVRLPGMEIVSMEGTQITDMRSRNNIHICDEMLDNLDAVLHNPQPRGHIPKIVGRLEDQVGFSLEYLHDTDCPWSYEPEWLDVCDSKGNVIRSFIPEEGKKNVKG